MVLEMARRTPWPATEEHSPEAETEAARAVPVLERHQVVLGELARAIQIETDVREADDEGDEREQQPECLVQKVAAHQMERDRDHRREHATLRVGWWSMAREIGI